MRWIVGWDSARPCRSAKSSLRCLWLSPAGVIRAPGRATTAVAMDQGLGAVPAVRPAQTPDLTGGETQEVGRFGHVNLAAIQGGEHDELLLRTLRQDDRVPIHASRIRGGGRR